MIGKTFTRTLCCLFVATLASGALLAQGLKIAPGRHSSVVVPYADTNSPDANITIFTNLGPTPTNLYNSLEGGYYVKGPTNVESPGEQWLAVPFTAKVACHAKTLQAAIGYISGTKKVRLGIYSDAAGAVGTLLGQKSATTIPDLGVCCAVVQVNLPGAGVALTAGTQYWLVATADPTAPDFAGAWQSSNNTNIGGNIDQGGWFTFSALWPAGLVKGTKP